ncbi:hypothetical protein [Vibrio sp. R78045]|uniref:hypothetical protein n=1 Tax=Vibrio sp. R78045 TaxID=3093868 RepID=UPI0036F2DBF2
MDSRRSKQNGNVLIGALLATVITGYLLNLWAQKTVAENWNESISLQSERLATVVNGVVRYQSSGGNPPALASPLAQWNTAGAPFEDGAVHTGLDWLKETTCSATATAPLNFIHCSALDRPNLGEDTIYRFVVSNDGVNINTRVSIVQESDNNIGMRRNGDIDLFLALKIANRAEPKVMFTSQGATNTMFLVDQVTAVISADVGLNVASTPFLRADGLVEAHGTQRYLDGASIEGVETVSAERFADYDRGTDTISTTHFIDMDGNSQLENVQTQTLTSPQATINLLSSTFIDATGAQLGNVNIDNVALDYFTQTNPNVQNTIAGELSIGATGDAVNIGNGSIGVDNAIYNNADTSYFIDLSTSGTTRLNDIVLTALGNRSISDLMPKFSMQGSRLVEHYNIIPKPSCADTGLARLLVTPTRWTSFLLDSNGYPRLHRNYNYVSADESTSTWRIRFETHSPTTGNVIPDYAAQGIAEVYCYYP